MMGVGVALVGGFEHALLGRVIDEIMSDLGHGSRIAAAHARRAHDADMRPRSAAHGVEELFRAEQGAGQGIADPDRQRRDRRIVLLHDIEMGIEGRRLEDLGEGELHRIGERREMRRRNLVIGVLDQMQMLDQQDRAGAAGRRVGPRFAPEHADRSDALSEPISPAGCLPRDGRTSERYGSGHPACEAGSFRCGQSFMLRRPSL